MAPRPKAYSYVRFSTPDQLKGDSLRRQTRLAEDYAKRYSLILDTDLNLRDLGVSAFRGANLETGALGYFLEAIRKGIVPRGSYLLVESLDRVSRKAARKAVRILEEIVEAGVTVVTLNDGKAYTEESLDGTDFLIAIIVLIRAHEESMTKSRRLKAAWVGKRLKIADGQALTTLTPGWIELDAQRKPVLIASRAMVVRGIVDAFLRGQGKHGIAKDLNEEGVPCFGRAKYWHRSYIDKVLASPALTGTFVPHIDDHSGEKFRRIPQEPVADYFPAVIDAETYERLQTLMNRSPLRGRHASKAMRNLLSGLATCPHCGGTMTRVDKGKKSVPSLVCAKAKTGAGCDYRSVRYERVEGAILKQYEAILAEMPHPDEDTESQLLHARAVVEATEMRIEELLALLEKNPSEALAARVAKMEKSLQVARGDLSEALDKASLTERKALALRVNELRLSIRAKELDHRRVNAALRSLFNRIVIDYGNNHLVLEWKTGGESSVFYEWPDENKKVARKAH